MATMADVQLRTDSLHLRCRITEETRNELALMKDDKIYAKFKATSPHMSPDEILMLRLGPQEGQQISVDLILMRSREAVPCTWIVDFLRAPDESGGLDR
jgi:hypothetical protein